MAVGDVYRIRSDFDENQCTDKRYLRTYHDFIKCALI